MTHHLRRIRAERWNVLLRHQEIFLMMIRIMSIMLPIFIPNMTLIPHIIGRSARVAAASIRKANHTLLGTTSASRRRLTQRFAPHAVIKQMCSHTPLPIHRIWLADMQKAAQPAAIPLRNCILTRQNTAIRQHSTGRHARVAVQNQRELRIRSASITAQHSTGKHAELAATPQEHLHTPTIHTVYARCAATEERQKRQKSLICRQTILSSFASIQKKNFGSSYRDKT